MGKKIKEDLARRIVKQFKKKTQKYCHIYTESVSPKPSIFDDKIGGQPYIPKGIPYPKTSTGEDMALVLQINLANHNWVVFQEKDFSNFFMIVIFKKEGSINFLFLMKI